MPCFIGIAYVRDDAFGADAATYPLEFTPMNWSLLPLLADPEPGELARLVLDSQRVSPGFPEAWQRRRIEWLRKNGGVVATAALVQANRALFEPEDRFDYMALVVFTLEDLPDVRPLLERIAEKVMELKDTDPAGPALREVAAHVTDETSIVFQRYRLPRAFAEGHLVYLADLSVHRPYLPGGYLSDSILRVIVEPGDEGAIEHLPLRET